MKMNLTFQVEGMSCNHCKMAVTNALKELDGVEKVEVSLEKGTVEVEYDDKKVTIEKMKNAIEDQGYDVK